MAVERSTATTTDDVTATSRRTTANQTATRVGSVTAHHADART